VSNLALQMFQALFCMKRQEMQSIGASNVRLAMYVYTAQDEGYDPREDIK